MRYYYKDSENNLYNLKEPHFLVLKDVEKEETIINEDGNEETITVTIQEWLLDDNYTQITEEEYKNIKNANQITFNSDNNKQIAKLKQQLAQYDYIGVKIATGCATIEEYADKIAQAQELRRQINELEAEL